MAIGTEMEVQIKRGASRTQQLLLFAGRDENVKAGEHGWHFLQKPFEMADLASRLDEAPAGTNG